jgi:large subunit ribosomal protein L2
MSYYSLVFLGSLSLEEKKKFHNTKSGYWRSLGFKSTVRGVAMNAVDHPHGGRTKAVRYQRTPWGKTTKFK